MGSPRKNKYIPHLAEFYFSPEFNWSREEARNLYESKHQKKSFYNTIQFEDCIMGMRAMSPDSVDLVIADPPFGIDFSGTEALYNRNANNVVPEYKEIIEDYASFSKEWIGFVDMENEMTNQQKMK